MMIRPRFEAVQNMCSKLYFCPGKSLFHGNCPTSEGIINSIVM